MTNKISIILITLFFVCHATGVDACLWNIFVNNIFSRVILVGQDVNDQQDNSFNNFTNVDSEEEVKEEAQVTAFSQISITTNYKNQRVHLSNEFLFSNYLLDLITPPPEV